MSILVSFERGYFNEFAEYVMKHGNSSDCFGEFYYEFVGGGDAGDVYRFRIGEDDFKYVLKVSVWDEYIEGYLTLDDVEMLTMARDGGDDRIVRMFDYGDHYVVNEYVDGIEVAEAFSCGLVDGKWVRDLVFKLACMVDEYMEQGVWLLDLTPNNVMIRDDFSWVVVDVGSYEELSGENRYSFTFIHQDLLGMYQEAVGI